MGRQQMVSGELGYWLSMRGKSQNTQLKTYMYQSRIENKQHAKSRIIVGDLLKGECFHQLCTSHFINIESTALILGNCDCFSYLGCYLAVV